MYDNLMAFAAFTSTLFALCNFFKRQEGKDGKPMVTKYHITEKEE